LLGTTRTRHSQRVASDAAIVTEVRERRVGEPLGGNSRQHLFTIPIVARTVRWNERVEVSKRHAFRDLASATCSRASKTHVPFGTPQPVPLPTLA
jgi:hypothetical protein